MMRHSPAPMRAAIGNLPTLHELQGRRYRCPYCGTSKFGSALLGDGTWVRQCHGRVTYCDARGQRQHATCSFRWHIDRDAMFFGSPNGSRPRYSDAVLQRVMREVDARERAHPLPMPALRFAR